MMSRPRMTFILLLAVLALARDARAAGSPYRLKWPYDTALVATGAAGSLAAFVGYPPVACFPDCEPPPGMLGIDRAVLGNYSPPAHSLANVMVLGLVLSPIIIDAADSRFDGWLEDTFVMLQSVLVTQALTQLSKAAVRRPAPLVYAPNVAQGDIDSPDASRSFISGHTSTSFAAATSYAVTFWKRHPHSPWRFVVLGVGQALALTVGLLKIEAGYHYPTDIAAGALVGGAVGLALPMLHTEW